MRNKIFINRHPFSFDKVEQVNSADYRKTVILLMPNKAAHPR